MNYYSMKLQNDSHLSDIQRERNKMRLANQVKPQSAPTRPKLVTMLLLLVSRF